LATGEVLKNMEVTRNMPITARIIEKVTEVERFKAKFSVLFLVSDRWNREITGI